jgi:ATP-dependent helicase/nuclease subunit A
VITAESLAARAKALQRGTLVHKLLQSLPNIAAGRRAEVANKFLVRNAEGWTRGECEALAKQVIAIIESEGFAPLFESGSSAEVSIVGRVPRRDGRMALVSGQIDRLVVTPYEVFIIDYKTNHAPPDSVVDAPRAYVRQLALYRAVLGRLHPGKPIRCALLWTENASIMEIPASALDAELQSAIA